VGTVQLVEKGHDMKKLVLAMMCVFVGTFGFGVTASAQYGADDDVVTEPPTEVVDSGGQAGLVDQGGNLPQTGSDGLGATAGIAAGLLAVGACLVMVTQLRRRNTGLAASP
jgi:hypothetical protein